MSDNLRIEESINWMIVYEDYDMGNEYFTDKESALKVFEQISSSWNAHLFKRVATNYHVKDKTCKEI